MGSEPGVASRTAHPTHTPPGDTSRQLPDHILKAIEHHLPPYTSTACLTAQALAGYTTYLAAHGAHTNLNEWIHWQQWAHGECRKNMKFSGQPCTCPCHNKKAE